MHFVRRIKNPNFRRLLTGMVIGSSLVCISSLTHAASYTSPIVGTNPFVVLNGGDTVTVNSGTALSASGAVNGINVTGGGIVVTQTGGTQAVAATSGGTINLGSGTVINLNAAGLNLAVLSRSSSVTADNLTVNAVAISGANNSNGYINAGTGPGGAQVLTLTGTTHLTVTGPGDNSTHDGIMSFDSTSVGGSTLRIADAILTIGTAATPVTGNFVGITSQVIPANYIATGTTDMTIYAGSPRAVLASQSGAMSLNNLNMTLVASSGDNYPIRASSSGTLTISGAVVANASSLANTYGYSGVSGGSITASGSNNMQLSGANAVGVYASGNTTLNINPPTGTFTVNGITSAAAIKFDNVGAAGANSVTVNNSTMTSTFNGIVAEGGTTNTANLTNTTITAAAGRNVMAASGNSTTTLNGSALTLTGASTVAAGSTFTANFAGGSTWNVTGDSNLTTVTNNASTIAYATPGGAIPFKTLTVNGTYTGTGGTLTLNTQLGNDSSPTDKLVVAGATTGTTTVNITNINGLGALTTNGILVIDTPVGTPSTAFTLAGGPINVGGYVYRLLQHADGKFYLESSLALVSVNKTANVTTLTPGGTVIYTLAVTNTSAVSASGTVISDPIPTGLTAYTWTCIAGGAAVCPAASGAGAINQTIATLPGNSSLTYTITATVSATPPASVVNTATVTPPAGSLCAPGNTAPPCINSAAVPPVPVVQFQKTTNAPSVVAGGTIQYTLTAINAGSLAAGGTVISDPLPSGLTSYTWTCTASGGAVCPNASGSGALNETIATFPDNSTVVYLITAKVSDPAPSSVTNTATAAPPGGGVCLPGDTPGPCSTSATISVSPIIPVPTTGRMVLMLMALLLAALAVAGMFHGRRSRMI